MAKHGASNPVGTMFPREGEATKTYDSSQPTQAEIDHTERMNNWFRESFANMFAPTLKPFAEKIMDAEVQRLNETIVSVNREMSCLHKQVAILSEVVKRAMTADRYQKHLHAVRDELDITVDYSPIIYGDDNDKDELRTMSNEPSIFKITTKTKPDETTDDTEPKEPKTWLQRMMGK